MEGALLDLGVEAPPSAGSQQQQPQQNLDPFGVPVTSAPQTAQKPQNPQAQREQSDFDSIFMDGQPQSSNTQQSLNVDALIESKVPVQENNNLTSSQASEPQQNTPTQQSVQPAPEDNGNATIASNSPANVEQKTEPGSVESASADNGAALDNKAKLKEIQKIFGGRWRLIRSEPYAEYLKAAGVGIMTRNRASSGTQDLQISVQNGYIYVNTSSLLHSQINKFKLDEALENVVLKTNQSVFCTYQNQKLELQMTPLDVAWSKTQGVQYSIIERGELMVIYTSGSHTCRRCYARILEVRVR